MKKRWLSGHSQTGEYPFAKAFLCDPFAGEWDRSSLYSGTAGASECANDGAVYTCEQAGHWADSKSVGSDGKGWRIETQKVREYEEKCRIHEVREYDKESIFSEVRK
ncbi:hypothetical protein WG8_3396 [Paenibacillus sp. Aloe-11]|nr:hypothetical protein WG8_3396 [Paenibacillus sp. Aloe-11]